MSIALYARVSTNKKQTRPTDPKPQDPEMQLEALRAYALARGWQIFNEYVDVGQSGAKESRPALDQLMNDARKGKITGVLVWRFDRFARSVKHLVTTLDEFQVRRIDFVSYSENIDTSTPMGRAMFAIIAAMAQLGRDLIRENVAAGVRRARARGGAWGRRRKSIEVPAGLSLRQAAITLGVSHETIRRRKAEAK